MNTKDKYHLLCNTETSIPIFSRDWWLDTDCGIDKWKVLLVEEKERITAAMPLYCPRQGIISMPSYTQTMGPWFAPESKDTKYTKTLGHRQVLCKQLLNTLKSYPYFMQNFHYGITDWLPFYWEGYRQTTRYTYMLKDIRNTKAILGNMSFNIRRNITKARDKYHITVKKGISIEEFLLVQAQTFKRQQITNKEDMEVLIKLINICRKRDQGDLWGGYDEQGRLQGFRINRVDGNKLYPQEKPRIKPRTVLYRNFDQEFERVLSRKSAERKIKVSILLTDNEFGFSLRLTDEDDNSITLAFPHEKELARTPQTENLKTQLAKLGNTPFEAKVIEVEFADNWFLPVSVLADYRRQAVEKLIAARRINYRQELSVWKQTNHAFPQTTMTYLGNVMNTHAVSFYEEHGVQRIAMVYEKEAVENAVLMFCKHCLRYSMGWCPIHQRVRSPFKEPYYLMSNDGKRFRLEFDCKNCQMKVKAVQ